LEGVKYLLSSRKINFMIARKEIPKQYQVWNHKWGAPSGRFLYCWAKKLKWGSGLLERSFFTALPSLRGLFGFQGNSRTREVEYPWAFYATPIIPGHKVLEIGGGLSGFQFVLNLSGCDVVNVDPGLEAHGRGWLIDEKTHKGLNRIFGTEVKLYNCFLKDAFLPTASFDRIFSISVLEHIPPNEILEIMQLAYNLLKPGGFFIITVDLFLNLIPFCNRETNEYGKNVSVKMLAESAPFKLLNGDRSELLGYPEFDKNKIMCNLDTLLLGTYPALAQMVVLEKPSEIKIKD
jgi:SAM-dependent methyltransferase